MDIDQSINLEVENTLDAAFLYLATGLFGLTVVLTTAQVLVRQIPILSFININWSVPVARFTLIIMTFIGGAVVTRNQEHISIDMILDWVGNYYPRFRVVVATIADAIVIGFLTIALYGAYLSTVSNWTTSVGAVQGITSGHLYLGIGVGLAGMLIYEVQHFVNMIRALLDGSARTELFEKDEVVDDV
ncbi:TRAP transporter small permease [Haloferax marisrubri]|uniref:Tripartite ATP-independent periplasmic transporters DctQ component domain-containing protein n=1 Tax=Haloferax marisrubri TaxID=1544719 RepID=A0A2P4NME3_9EURY|nr:TRAP transporter small permease subunit [Haloferax marisrubri]POG54294.1 hypothetical protein AUR65_016790 [Haloferax marisrubri]